MYLSPTYYFRPLTSPITLSYSYEIILRNPTPSELRIFEQNLELVADRLSDSEKRRIIYTLYPFGVVGIEGSINEIFVKELAKIWVVIEAKKELPFEEDLIDYGYLIGYISNKNQLRNPAGFVCDIRQLNIRQILRALKQELPKAANIILNPSTSIQDLDEIQELSGLWEGLLAQSSSQKFINLAKILRRACMEKDIIKKFADYCAALEILITHNPHHSQSKSPINKQFAAKAALIRHLMIKSKDQNIMVPPSENNKLYQKIYDLRSDITHGRIFKISKSQIAQYLNHLYPSLRLAMELQVRDPLLLEFLQNNF
ncbi:MAG: hypothetical protein ACRCS8_05990 [Brevinema sp.]